MSTHFWANHSASFGADFGVDYAQVQAKLNALGANPPLTVDGSWGPKSKMALIAYQQAHGLAPDGVPGPATLAALGIAGAISSASTMGSTTPASAAADAKAFDIAQRAGKGAGMTDKQIQYVVSVARGEGHYGNGWANPNEKTVAVSAKYGLTGTEGAGSNNWGAVQGAASAGSFPHVDYHQDGTDYLGHYKKYSSPEEGFLDMARVILNGGKRGAQGAQEIQKAIEQGNLRNAVYAQHANGYFELNPESYLSAVLRNYNGIMAGIKWPALLAENGITPIAGLGAGAILLLGAGLAYYFRKQLFGMV